MKLATLVLLAPALAAAQPARGTVRGTVTDAHGAPVANAAVTVGDAQTVTDRAGFYSLDVPAGTRTIEVHAPGAFASLEGLDVPVRDALRENVRLPLAPTPPATPATGITGIVTRRGGPVADTDVRVDGAGLAYLTRTDGAGRFAIPIAAPGVWDVTVDGHRITVIVPRGGWGTAAVALPVQPVTLDTFYCYDCDGGPPGEPYGAVLGGVPQVTGPIDIHSTALVFRMSDLGPM